MADINFYSGAFKIDFDLHETDFDLWRRNTTTGEYAKYGTFVYLMDCRNEWRWNYITDKFGESCMDTTELADILSLLSMLKPPIY